MVDDTNIILAQLRIGTRDGGQALSAAGEIGRRGVVVLVGGIANGTQAAVVGDAVKGAAVAIGDHGSSYMGAVVIDTFSESCAVDLNKVIGQRPAGYQLFEL